MIFQEVFMKRAIQIAKNGSVYPNPRVGCLIEKSGKIIGEGWHYNCGGPHAEVNAINSIKDFSILDRATIYVTLEPCLNFGKTAPCVDLILKKRISKVFIGVRDPNERVKGKSIQKLKSLGLEVVTGFSETLCRWMNRRFFSFYENNRPYVIFKWAQSLNGYLDVLRQNKKVKEKKNNPFWISGPYARQGTHKWRSDEVGVLVGTRTALNDNPKLNVRNLEEKRKNPLRMTLDKNGMIPFSYFLYDEKSPTLIFSEKLKEVYNKNVTIIRKIFVNGLVKTILHSRKIQSIIIEGGKKTFESFIKENLWDEARIFIGNIELNNGLNYPEISGETLSKKKIYQDIILILIH